MKKSLNKYGFSEHAVTMIKSIVDLIDKNDLHEMERRIASLALYVCDKVESGLLSPKIGDEYFTLLDLYIEDNYPQLEIKKEIRDIIFEGMILHDYGKDYGSNLSLMRSLAEKVLEHEQGTSEKK